MLPPDRDAAQKETPLCYGAERRGFMRRHRGHGKFHCCVSEGNELPSALFSKKLTWPLPWFGRSRFAITSVTAYRAETFAYTRSNVVYMWQELLLVRQWQCLGEHEYLVEIDKAMREHP